MPSEFEQAIQLFNAGRLAECEGLCRRILQQQPRQADALHLLGMVALHCGHAGPAEQLIRQAIGISPHFAPMHCNLANALTAGGKLDEALAAIRRADELEPNSPVNLNTLAMVHMRRGEFGEAITACQQAITVAPTDPGGHFNLAMARQAAGEADAAIEQFKHVLQLAPQFDAAHYGLATTLHAEHRWAEAEAAYQQTLKLNPNHLDARHNLGLAQQSQGKLDEALAAYEQALKLKPDFALTHNNIGNVHREAGDVPAADVAYRRAVELAPSEPMFQSNLILNHVYLWPPEADASREAIAAWNDRFIRPLGPKIHSHANSRDPDRTLKIGYVSNDFRQHASALFLRPLLREHDRQQVNVTCYVHGVRPDAVTKDFQQLADAWRNVDRLNDEQLARQVREDGIDILVDLKLHTAGTRLSVFGHKPAPVQISWLGYPGSAGVETIDYRLTDRFIEPPGESEAQPDRPLHLPGCFWCYDPAGMGEVPDAEVGPLPANTNQFITFGSLNAAAKVNAAVLDAWANILLRVPKASLRLLWPAGRSREKVLQTFEAAGVSADRICFISPGPRANYLRQYQQIDLGLDPFPYNGHTTSLDSLWMGVPFVTLIGQTPVGRAGFSQLSNLNMAEDLATTTIDQYIDKAVAFAGNWARLDELRRSLRGRMQQSPLMDAPAFARGVESAYRTAWRSWCAADA